MKSLVGDLVATYDEILYMSLNQSIQQTKNLLASLCCPISNSVFTVVKCHR